MHHSRNMDWREFDGIVYRCLERIEILFYKGLKMEQNISLWSIIFTAILMLAGVVRHWYVKHKAGEVENLWVYLFKDRPGRTAITGGTIIGSIAVTTFSGLGDLIDPRLIYAWVVDGASIPRQTFALMCLVYQSGWQLDSSFNRGTKPAFAKK